ncbi:MAG: efflux transporter outer membrane subunit [Stappiaceae bacterium]
MLFRSNQGHRDRTNGLKMAQSFKLLGVVTGALMLSGCIMIGPDFVTPKTPVVDRWKEANDLKPNKASGLTTRSEPVIAWWETFKDPVLNQLIDEAYQQNLSLQIAGARVLEARAQLGIAFGELFPQTQRVGVGYEKRKISSNFSPARDIERVIDLDLDFAHWDAGFDATWEIDLWGGIRRGVQSAKANLASQIASYDDALVTLTGDVATVYVNIRALQAGLGIAWTNVKLQEKSLNITELRFKNGVTTELDVEEAKTLLNNTKAIVPGLQIQLEQSLNALAVLLGKAPEDMEKLLGKYGRIPRTSSKVAVGIPNQLLRRRPDIRAAEMEAAAQAGQIGVALNDLYPQFVLVGQIGVRATDVSDLLQGPSVAGVINPGIVWNIFNYGRIKNNVRVQDARYQALIANYQNTVVSAYMEVENALVAYKKSRTQAVYYGRSVRSSRKATEIALLQYQDGTADYSRVLNTQSALLEAESNLISTQAEVASNLVALYKALGGGWQVRVGQEFLPDTVLAEMAHRTDWGDLLAIENQSN